MFLVTVSCSDSALSSILTIVKRTVQLIQIIGPIIAILSLAIHLISLVKNPEDKKAIPKIKNSLIALVVLFFIPLLVDVVSGMLGSSTNFSSCWNNAPSIIQMSTTYQEIDEKDRSQFFTDPEEYEKGVPKPTTSSATSSPSLVDDSKYSQYETVASCESDTLKYRIISVNGNDLVILWVQNPNMQLNGALAVPNSMGRLPAETIMNNEISANGYQNKCMVAVNASFFSYGDGSPVSAVVINKGNIVKNNGSAGGCIGVDSSNKLIECSFNSANDIVSKGVRNTFGISSAAGLDDSGPKANRTQICQIDSNNFVLLSGSGTVGGTAQVTNNVTGCSNSYNLDGGGSRKLYYKDKSSSSMTKRFGGGREVPDMLYFVEA